MVRRLGAGPLTSQYPVSTWHETMGDHTVADAILDRLVHTAHIVELKGESLRKRRAAAAERPDWRKVPTEPC